MFPVIGLKRSESVVSPCHALAQYTQDRYVDSSARSICAARPSLETDRRWSADLLVDAVADSIQHRSPGVRKKTEPIERHDHEAVHNPLKRLAGNESTKHAALKYH